MHPFAIISRNRATDAPRRMATCRISAALMTIASAACAGGGTDPAPALAVADLSGVYTVTLTNTNAATSANPFLSCRVVRVDLTAATWHRIDCTEPDVRPDGVTRSGTALVLEVQPGTGLRDIELTDLTGTTDRATARWSGATCRTVPNLGCMREAGTADLRR